MIEILTPWNLIVLILIAIATTLLVGHVSTRIVTRVIKKLFGIKMDTVSGDVLEKLFVYVGLGFIFIIIYSIVLSIFSFLNQIGVFLVIALLLIVESRAIVMNRRMEKRARTSTYLGTVKDYVTSIARKPGQVFLAGLLVASVIWYFSPAIQLASYPGGDDRAYLFITKLFIDRGTAFTAIDYPYAYPYMDHLLMAGFMTVASFFYIFLQTIGLSTTIPVIHLFLILLYFSLTPISMYLLTMKLSGNRELSITVSLAALFLWKSILMYWSWGGVGEAMGYFLVPLLALIDFKLNENLMRNRFGLGLKTLSGMLIIKSVLLVIAMYIHFYSLFLFVFMVMIFSPFLTLRNYLRGEHSSVKNNAKIYLKMVFPYVILSLVVVVTLIGAITLQQLTGSTNVIIERLYNFLIANPQDILNYGDQIQWTAPYLVLRNGYGLDYALSQLMMILNQYNGGWILPYIVVYIFCVVYLRSLKNRERSFYVEEREVVGFANVMTLTGLIFFLFVQNSPFGWYYVPYPLAKSVLAVRLYYEFNVFLIFVEALPIYLVYSYAKKRIAGLDEAGRRRSNRRLRRRSTRHTNLKRIGATAIALVFVVSVSYPYVGNPWGDYAYQRIQSVVTPNDLDAFRWIEANTPRNATFFAWLWDAGGYIYIYTGRTVLPPDALRAWSLSSEIWMPFGAAETMLIEGNITKQLVQILEEHNVSYVYAGDKTQYNDPPINATALVQSPYFEVTFHQGGAYVLKINETL